MKKSSFEEACFFIKISLCIVSFFILFVLTNYYSTYSILIDETKKFLTINVGKLDKNKENNEKILLNDGQNKISVHVYKNEWSFSIQDVKYERKTIKLFNGIVASNIIFVNEKGKIKYLVFFNKNKNQYVFNGELSKNFYKENKYILELIVKSLIIY